MTTAIFLRRLITILGGLVIVTLAVLEVLAAHPALPRVPWMEDVPNVVASTWHDYLVSGRSIWSPHNDVRWGTLGVGGSSLPPTLVIAERGHRGEPEDHRRTHQD
jgi:hypothetical protein